MCCNTKVLASVLQFFLSAVYTEGISGPLFFHIAEPLGDAIYLKVDEELGVYWINTWSKGALVKQKEEPIVPNGSLNVDSYYGHSFLVVDDQVRQSRVQVSLDGEFYNIALCRQLTCVVVVFCRTYTYASADIARDARDPRHEQVTIMMYHNTLICTSMDLHLVSNGDSPLPPAPP